MGQMKFITFSFLAILVSCSTPENQSDQNVDIPQPQGSNSNTAPLGVESVQEAKAESDTTEQKVENLINPEKAKIYGISTAQIGEQLSMLMMDTTVIRSMDEMLDQEIEMQNNIGKTIRIPLREVVEIKVQ